MKTTPSREVKMYHALTRLDIAESFYDMFNERFPELARLNILISFTHFKNQSSLLRKLKTEGKVKSTFLDSATFGINNPRVNAGKWNLLKVYLEAIRRIGQDFDFISSYDDRFNEPQHNWLNYEDIRDELRMHDAEHGSALASKLVPVIHAKDGPDGQGEQSPAEEFMAYCEEGASLIGLGSQPILSDESMEAIAEVRKDYPEVRMHRFGSFDHDFIVTYDVDSADSCKYFRSTQFGREAWFWDGEKCELVRFDVRKVGIPPRFSTILKDTFGWDRNDLLSKVERIWMVNLFAHQQMQHFLTNSMGI